MVRLVSGRSASESVALTEDCNSVEVISATAGELSAATSEDGTKD